MQLFNAFSRTKPKPPAVNLRNIRVASPCPANWETMVGNEHVRHCDHCNLNVYNLSAMTEQKALALIAEKEGRLCIRYYQRPDGTILTQNCVWSLRTAARKASRMAAAVLMAIVSASVAVAKSKPPQAACKCQQLQQKGSGMKLTVTDQDGAVIPNAEVALAGKSETARVTGFTGAAGVWSQSKLDPGEYEITVKFPGFRAFTGAVNIQKGMLAELKLKLSVAQANQTVTVQAEGIVTMGTTMGLLTAVSTPTIPVVQAGTQRSPLKP